MQSTLYSRHELVTTPLGIDASIPALPLVRVHQLYSFEHFYERGEKDTCQMPIQCIKNELDFPAASTAEFARSYDP